MNSHMQANGRNHPNALTQAIQLRHNLLLFLLQVVFSGPFHRQPRLLFLDELCKFLLGQEIIFKGVVSPRYSYCHIA